MSRVELKTTIVNLEADADDWSLSHTTGREGVALRLNNALVHIVRVCKARGQAGGLMREALEKQKDFGTTGSKPAAFMESILDRVYGGLW